MSTLLAALTHTLDGQLRAGQPDVYEADSPALCLRELRHLKVLTTGESRLDCERLAVREELACAFHRFPPSFQGNAFGIRRRHLERDRVRPNFLFDFEDQSRRTLPCAIWTGDEP